MDASRLVMSIAADASGATFAREAAGRASRLRRGELSTICRCRKRCKVAGMTTTTRAAVLGLLLTAGPIDRAWAQDTHPTFTVGTATAPRGQKAYGVLKVPAGSDAGYDIPVAVVHGAKPGPVLAIVSGAHGTEYASIIAVQKLIDAVKPA